MVYVYVDKRKKQFIVHEDEGCKRLQKLDLKGALEGNTSTLWMKFRDIQRAKFEYLKEFSDYKLLHHCEIVRNNQSSGGTGVVPRDVPFNDYIRHHQSVYGPIGKRVNLSALPKWLRLFYYGVIGVIVVGFIIVLIYSFL